jgi:hypothetical protein
MRAVCEAPGGAGSIWKYIEALARATRVSGRFVLGFRTDLHFADAVKQLEMGWNNTSQIPTNMFPYRQLCGTME